MAHADSLRTPLLWTAYVLLPVAGWGLLHGAPVGLFGAAMLCATWWTWWFRGPLPGRQMLVLLVLLKLLFLPVQIGRGLQADYFANPQWAPPVEHSTDFPGRSFTRIDPRLAFGAPATPDFPLYFLNDAARFNYYRPGEPNRATLPFSVTWQGSVRVTTPKDRQTFYLHGKDVSAELWVDGAQTVRLDPSAEDALERALWPAGIRRLTVRVSAAAGGSHSFEAGFVDDAGKRTPFDQSDVMARPYPSWRILLDRVIRMLSLAIDAAAIAVLIACAVVTFFRALLAAIVGRHRDALLALGWLAAIVGGFLFARGAERRLVLLEGGQDFLTYETYARDIALHGPLMLLGRPLGQAAAFYYQPLYSYFLALVHMAVGEDLSGVYLAQWLLAACSVLVVWRIAARLFGEQMGKAALAIAAVFFVLNLVPLAGLLLSENLFIPLLCGWCLLMIGMADPASPDRSITTGWIGGLATLARSTLLAGWVLALPVLAAARRRAGKPWRALALMVAVMCVVVALATIRNAIASRTFVPVASSFGINFYLGNQPPPDVPSAFATNALHNALYALGFFNGLVPGTGTAPGLIATWLAALIGIAVLLWGSVPEGLRGPARALPLALGISHLIAVIIIFPNGYGVRLMLPIYIMLAPYAALGMMKTVDFLVPPEEE